jgi:hypothetical protein
MPDVGVKDRNAVIRSMADKLRQQLERRPAHRLANDPIFCRDKNSILIHGVTPRDGRTTFAAWRCQEIASSLVAADRV